MRTSIHFLPAFDEPENLFGIDVNMSLFPGGQALCPCLLMTDQVSLGALHLQSCSRAPIKRDSDPIARSTIHDPQREGILHSRESCRIRAASHHSRCPSQTNDADTP